MEITKEEINDMIWHTLTSGHDGYINGRSEVIERTWTIIEKLQSENTALKTEWSKLKKEIDILILEKQILRKKFEQEYNSWQGNDMELEEEIAELEAELAELEEELTLLKAEQ